MSKASKISPTLLLLVATLASSAQLSCQSDSEPSDGFAGAASGGRPGESGGSSSAGGAHANGGSSGSNANTGGTKAAGGTTARGGATATGGASSAGSSEATSGGEAADGGASTNGGATTETGGQAGDSNAGGAGASAPPIAPASGKRWQLTFSEEFDGADYDHQKLSPCFDWNYGDCTNSFNDGREHYEPDQIQVGDGTAKLIAAPLNPPLSSSGCYQGECSYKSGLLSTCRPSAADGSDYLYTFTYGYVEARMKFPGTQGFFTAFWMLPANPDYDYRSEIDIVEILGDDPESIFMTYHYNDRSESHAVNSGTKNNGKCPVKDYSQGFHNFGVDWQPDHVAWYIDGVKCDQFDGTTDEIENGPMQIILDLMVDHSWQQRWGVTLKDTTLVRQIELDYLRVYQQK